ncbi:hypothetical protein Pmani_004317 [Petrolisthes manimaculis]|nr:hypothetical protein Pmani_004317 [Petrolisthes manimaculis]
MGLTRVRRNFEFNIPGAKVGRVEVLWQGQWGTVCDQGFTKDDTKVVCRSLGLRNGWMVPFYSINREIVTGPVWLEKPSCQGDETWLGECPGASWGTSSCHHTRIVSIFCYDQGVKVRLAGGEQPETGRVEVRLGGQWGTICDDFFDHLDAQVSLRSQEEAY